MMIYLFQFFKVKLKFGVFVRLRFNLNRVRVYGSGLEFKGNQVGVFVRFIVEIFSVGKGFLEVIVLNFKGKKEIVSLWEGVLWRGFREDAGVVYYKINFREFNMCNIVFF